jgi:hypothetical protein
MRGIHLLVGLAALALGSDCFADDAFDKTIAPLLARRCLECHRGAEAKGELDLSHQQKALAGGESGVAIVPGKASESLLWQRISDGEMPPKKPLPEAERALLKAWIESGAKWGADPIDPFRYTTDARAGYDWWSLQPIVRPAVPTVSNDAARHNPIDAFVQAKLSEQGLTPSPPAERQVLLRRLSLDLLGLPPAPADVNAYRADRTPDATARLIDRLLASPHYGERWGRHWLDLARFGESQGFERDKLRTDSWRYRDWVVSALNRDVPYDQFVRWQVAGDVLEPTRADAIAATGFLVAGPLDEVGKQQQSAAMKAVVRQDELEDYVSVVGQTFLGLTVNCARCHDHKFDPILQKEYYQLAAALAGVEHGSRPIPPDAAGMNNQAVAALRARLASLNQQIAARENAARAALAAERKARFEKTVPAVPLAEWTFDKDLRDARGELHATASEGATINAGHLTLDGKAGHALSEPLTKDLGAKTLVAWVKLANLTQRGGGAIGVQTLDGGEFDGIVFGEQEPERWMAGSDSFVRYKSFGGPPEKEADQRLVCMAIVFADDGTITAYRDGVAYGNAYKSSGLKKFKKGAAQVSFGLRHSPVDANKMLAGALDKAMLFDRALSGEEVAVLAGAAEAPVAEAELLARLSDDDKTFRAAALFEREQIADQIKRYETFVAYAVAPQTPHPVHVLARGEPGKPLAQVAPGGVASLVGLSADFGLKTDAPDSDRRRALANWLVDQKGPPAARVMVNRLWHHHFGVGIVETPNDFGFNGGRPSHPELLDWLASELIDSGWSLKHVQRLIVQSATYQQASLPRADALAKDADNRLLWRKTPQRLDAETLRDAILTTTGALNTDVGGPGFADFRTFVFNSQFYEIVDVAGHTFDRRSLYRTWIRSGRSPLLDAFDCPDPSTKTPARAVTTTPLQALALLNNSFVLRMSASAAERIERQAGDDPAAQVALAYQNLLGRAANDQERTATTAFVRQHGLAALVRVLLNSNEFLYVD